MVVLDASNLTLVRVLALREVFPDSQYVDLVISCLAVDPALKIVRALYALILCSTFKCSVHHTRSRSWHPCAPALLHGPYQECKTMFFVFIHPYDSLMVIRSRPWTVNLVNLI